METLNTLLLWLHLMSVALAGCAAFAIPAVLGLMRRSEPAQRPVFGMVIGRLAALARMALVLLILTGSALLWFKYGGTGSLSGWFDLKLGLVAVLAALAVFNIFNARAARSGNAAAAARMPLLAGLGTALLAMIVLSAVLSFN